MINYYYVPLIQNVEQNNCMCIAKKFIVSKSRQDKHALQSAVHACYYILRFKSDGLWPITS